jgi:hypothetical protein
MFETKARENVQDTQEIQRQFPGLKFSLQPLAINEHPGDLPECDIAFCTSWPTEDPGPITSHMKMNLPALPKNSPPSFYSSHPAPAETSSYYSP